MVPLLPLSPHRQWDPSSRFRSETPVSLPLNHQHYSAWTVRFPKYPVTLPCPHPWATDPRWWIMECMVPLSPFSFHRQRDMGPRTVQETLMSLPLHHQRYSASTGSSQETLMSLPLHHQHYWASTGSSQETLMSLPLHRQRYSASTGSSQETLVSLPLHCQRYSAWMGSSQETLVSLRLHHQQYLEWTVGLLELPMNRPCPCFVIADLRPWMMESTEPPFPRFFPRQWNMGPCLIPETLGLLPRHRQQYSGLHSRGS